MTTVFRSRQRAEEFAARVDGTSPVRAAADARTERLVGVTHVLRAHRGTDPAATPREAFAVDLRERLLAEAAVVLTPQNAGLALPTRHRGKRERRIVAVASAAVLIGGTAGMATAAQNAMPGEALYPIKRGIEKAEAGLSMSSAGRGRDLLHQATDRLGEAGALVDDGPATGASQVPHTLRSFTAQAQQGSELLMSSYADNRDPDTIATVREFAAASLRSVDALAGTAPAEAQPDLRNAALALRDIDARARRLCDTCADLPAVTVPRMFLASAEVDRAMRRLDVAGLDNSHPVIADKQAVRRADAAAPRTGTRAGTSSGQKDGTTSSVPQAPSVTAAPTAPTSDAPLPALPGTSPTPTVKITVDPGTSTLGDGLGDVVETILPDATGLLP